MQVSKHPRHIPTEPFLSTDKWLALCRLRELSPLDAPEVGVLGIVLVPTETACRAIPGMPR
jgi:hypothetical protein